MPKKGNRIRKSPACGVRGDVLLLNTRERRRWIARKLSRLYHVVYADLQMLKKMQSQLYRVEFSFQDHSVESESTRKVNKEIAKGVDYLENLLGSIIFRLSLVGFSQPLREVCNAPDCTAIVARTCSCCGRRLCWGHRVVDNGTEKCEFCYIPTRVKIKNETTVSLGDDHVKR